MAILQVGGTTVQNTNASATSMTGTYTPTAGNAVVVFVFTVGAVTNLTVQDSLGNTLTAGPVIGSTLQAFYQASVPSPAPTNYKATWTTGRQSSMVLEEYSGASGVVSAQTPSASGSGTTATITTNILQPNNWVVAGMVDSTTNTFTATVGNGRQQVNGTAGHILIDNTSAGSSVTCTATLTSASWAIVAVELGGPGQAIALQEVALAVESVYSNSEVRVPQEVALAVVNQTNAKATVSQEVILVLASNNRLRQLAVRKIITAWRKRPKKHAIQIPIGYQLHGGRRKRPYTSVIT